MLDGECSTKVLGIDIKIIADFLELIRDKYPQADMANYFLELNSQVSGINIATTNQRDVLSHLCTILSNPGLPTEKLTGQITAAEEHFRRAIIESYQLAVDIKFSTISTVLSEYKSSVLPRHDKLPALNGAPTLLSIRDTFKEIECLRLIGRQAKNKNLWDEEWEKGVKAYIEAFNKVSDLESTLEDFTITAKSSSKFKTYLGYVSLVLNIILAGLIVYVLAK